MRRRYPSRRPLLRRLGVDLSEHLADRASQLVGRWAPETALFLREHKSRHAGDALVGGFLRLPEISRRPRRWPDACGRRGIRPTSAAACTSTLTSVRSPPS